MSFRLAPCMLLLLAACSGSSGKDADPLPVLLDDQVRSGTRTLGGTREVARPGLPGAPPADR